MMASSSTPNNSVCRQIMNLSNISTEETETLETKMERGFEKCFEMLKRIEDVRKKPRKENVTVSQECAVPNSEKEWATVAKEYETRWNFPNCIGAIDGKHVAIKCPTGSGSEYYNYKHFFSIVLLAIVDADYKFIYVDVGKNGRVSDGGVFANSPIHDALENNLLNIPPKRKINGILDMPYVIVGDEAFPMKRYIMKPYPNRDLDLKKRIFNYRLSRARRVVENAFGILTSRFGVFQKAIGLEPEKVEKIILAACVLHNFLRCKTSSENLYMPPGSVDHSRYSNPHNTLRLEGVPVC